MFALLSPPEPWQDYVLSGIFIFCSIILWINILTGPRRKKRAGFLLWNLGRPSTYRVMLIPSVIFGVSAILQTSRVVDLARNGFPEGDGSPQYYLSQVILYWSTAIYLFWAGLSRLQFRENGIYFKFGLIKWEQIASYKWEGEKGNTLTVWLKQRFPLFLTRSWAIPSVHKAAIENIFAQYLSAGTRSTRNSL